MLRLQPGDDITLFDGSGGEWHARIDVIGRSTVSVHLIEHVATTRELPFEITPIIVSKYPLFRARAADALDHRRMIQGIGKDHAAGQQATER